MVWQMSENPKYEYPKAARMDSLNELKRFFFEQFGDSLWIPRDGISKKGNIYITLVIKTNRDLDLWYSKRKGELPLELDLPPNTKRRSEKRVIEKHVEGKVNLEDLLDTPKKSTKKTKKKK